MIVSARNRLLKNMRRLRRCKGDHALLEGPHLLAAALEAGLELETVLVTPEFLGRPEGEALAERLPEPPTLVAAELLAGLCDADSPRGSLALAHLPRGGAATLPRRADGLYVFADGIQDPGNLGALGRSCEALGGCALALGPGSVHANHPRALRASAGSLLRLPTALCGADELDAHLAALRPTWAALVPRGGDPPAPLRRPVVLAVGAEGPGLSPTLAARAHHRLTLPLEPPVESLNLVVAAALALWEISRPTAR